MHDYALPYRPPHLPLVFVEEVERFDTEHPGDTDDHNDDQNNVNRALERIFSTLQYTVI